MKKCEWKEVSKRGKAHHILLLDSIVTLFQEKRFGDAHKISWNPEHYRQFNSNRWFSAEDYDQYVNVLQEGEKKQQGYLLENAREYEKRIVAFKEFVDKNKNIDFSNKDDSFIITIFNEWFEHTKNVWCFAYDAIFINRFLPEEVINKITEKEKDPVKKAYVLAVLMRPDKPTQMWQEKRALLSLVKQNKVNGNYVKEEIKKHQQKFAHLGYYFFQGKAYSYEDIEKRFQDYLSLSDGEIEKEWKEIIKQEENNNETKKIIASLGLDNETIHQIQILKTWAWISNYVDETYSYSVHHLSSLWRTIANILGLSWNEVFSLRHKEIIHAIKNREDLGDLKKIAQERYKDHAFIVDGQNVSLLIGKALEEYKENQEKEQEIDVTITEIKGQSASMGIASGKIHIIHSVEEVSAFKRGEILVAVATNPTYLPAMEKAAAIITDEGGLLSHAAVVSRELNIPCVVGTKVVTKIFKDGDTVKVDATKGIITKLERDKE